MAAFSTVRSTTFQPKTSPNYLIIALCQTKTAIFKWFFYWFACVSSGSVASILSCSAKKLLSSSKALLFHLFLILPVPAGTGNIKNNWNKKALEDDNEFLSEQEKIESSEPSETQANQ